MKKEIVKMFLSGQGPTSIANTLNRGIIKEDEQYLLRVIRGLLMRKLGQAKYDEQLDVIIRVRPVGIKKKPKPPPPTLQDIVVARFKAGHSIYKIANDLTNREIGRVLGPVKIREILIERLGEDEFKRMSK